MYVPSYYSFFYLAQSLAVCAIGSENANTNYGDKDSTVLIRRAAGVCFSINMGLAAIFGINIVFFYGKTFFSTDVICAYLLPSICAHVAVFSVLIARLFFPKVAYRSVSSSSIHLLVAMVVLLELVVCIGGTASLALSVVFPLLQLFTLCFVFVSDGQRSWQEQVPKDLLSLIKFKNWLSPAYYAQTILYIIWASLAVWSKYVPVDDGVFNAMVPYLALLFGTVSFAMYVNYRTTV